MELLDKAIEAVEDAHIDLAQSAISAESYNLVSHKLVQAKQILLLLKYNEAVNED